MIAEGSAVTGRLLTFLVGPGRFAILLDDVLGVQDPAGSGAAADLGAMFQGQPVAAVDARRQWWGDQLPPATLPPPAVIVVGSRGGATALMVDRIEGIVEGVEMRPLPPLIAPFARGMFRGLTLHADGGRLVVDPGAISGTSAVGGEGGPGET